MDIYGQNFPQKLSQAVTWNWTPDEIHGDTQEPPTKIQKTVQGPYCQQVIRRDGGTTTITFVPNQAREGVSDPGQTPVQNYPASKHTLSALRNVLLKPP